MADNELREKLELLENQKKELQEELRRLRRKPPGVWGYLLLIVGLLLVAIAILFSHNVSAFIGIALTFWGALLFYIRPTRFIKKEVLDSTIVDAHRYIRKLLDELEFNGTPKYISPRTLHGLRSAIVYILKSDESHPPSDEQLSHERVFIENPSVIKLTPPGLGLSNLLEDELKTNFSTVDLEYLRYNLERALVDGLEVAEAFEMVILDPNIRVEIRGTIFDEIIDELDEINDNCLIGDPLSSAIACILARSTSRTIIITKIEREIEKKLIRIMYKMESQIM